MPLLEAYDKNYNDRQLGNNIDLLVKDKNFKKIVVTGNSEEKINKNAFYKNKNMQKSTTSTKNSNKFKQNLHNVNNMSSNIIGQYITDDKLIKKKINHVIQKQKSKTILHNGHNNKQQDVIRSQEVEILENENLLLSEDNFDVKIIPASLYNVKEENSGHIIQANHNKTSKNKQIVIKSNKNAEDVNVGSTSYRAPINVNTYQNKQKKNTTER